MKLENKISLITGASKGIGKAVAIALSKEGAVVVINYLSDGKEAQNVLSECNKYSSGNFIVKADITNEDEVKTMFKDVKEHFGSLDILINNAAIFDLTDNPTNLKAFENIWNINFFSQVRVTKYTLKLMNEGKIINVSSIHGRLGYGHPNAIAYSALKAAFESYTKNLAKNLAPKILVNAIAPGRTLTPMWGDLTKEKEKELGEDQLINRFILPEEIADGIIFLLRNDAVCGEILTIDGGMSLKTLG